MMINKRKIMIIVLFCCGLAILLYPIVSNEINRYFLKQQIRDYEDLRNDLWEEAKKPEAKENRRKIDEMYKEMQAYNEKIYIEGQKNLSDPFAYEKPSLNLEKYGLNGNMIAYIIIPRMDIELPIYLGATKDNMKKGAAQLSETSLPIGGPNTNTVIAAHRGMTSKEMFRYIDKLQLGDEITITNFWESLSYKVAEIKIIKPHEIDKILIQEGRDLVTLITCNPYGANYERYVVYCERKTE